MDRITQIDLLPQRVLWHPPYALSMGRTIEGSDHTFVRLRTAQGLEGWDDGAFAGRTYREAHRRSVERPARAHFPNADRPRCREKRLRAVLLARTV